MKKLILWAGILLLIAACSTPKGIVKVKSIAEETTSEDDSLEYSLETFDSRFETWYMMHGGPASYRSQSYYETWNRQYVSEWNYKATTGRNSFFEPIIGYEPTVDYGFELNHKLFYYFMYVERELKIQVLPNGPNIVIF
jgi:hypothetical protein